MGPVGTGDWGLGLELDNTPLLVNGEFAFWGVFVFLFTPPVSLEFVGFVFPRL